MVSHGIESRLTQFFSQWAFSHKALNQRHLFTCKGYALGHQGEEFLFLWVFFTCLEKSEKEDGLLHVMQSFKNRRTFLQKHGNKKLTIVTSSILSFINNSYEKKKILEGEKVSEICFPYLSV